MSTFPAAPGAPTSSAAGADPAAGAGPGPSPAAGAASGAADAVAPRPPSERASCDRAEAGPAGPSLSLELFPPRPGRHATQTWGALDRLLGAGPDFVSVTYRPAFVITGAPPGAPGRAAAPAARVRVVRERNPSEDVVAHVLATSAVPLMAHLTCIGYRRASVVEIVRAFLDMGVRRFLALRGDPPRGFAADDVVGELAHADELVRVIREVEAEYFDDGARHLQIAVAAYPAAADRGREADVLAAKRAAGADLAITQVFYDVEDYLALLCAAGRPDIGLPILPGIIPLTDLRRLTRLEALSGVRVPEHLVRTLERSAGARTTAAGIDATLRLAAGVLDGGAPGVHLYTFNRTRPALDLVSQLRLGRILDGRRPDPLTQREVWRSYLNAVPGDDAPTARMPGAARP